MPSDSSEITDIYKVKVLSWLLFVTVLIPHPSFTQDKVIATYTLSNKVIATYTLPDTQSSRFKLRCSREVSPMIGKFCWALLVATCGTGRPIRRMSFGC